MSATSITIEPAVVPDPNAIPPANAVDTATGGVQIDPNKPAGDQKPDEKLILGKFKDQAALEAAYTELSKKLGGDKPTVQQVQEAVKTAGLDMNALNREFAEKGELSAESLTALAAKGITKTMVDAYVGGLKAQATQQRASLAEVAGGEDGLTNVYEWAKANITPQEIAAYNAVIATGNMDAAKLALHGIVGRFTAATGKEPSLVSGETAPQVSDEPAFESNAQVEQAMRDPRYQTDEAYRQKVARRLAISNVFSVRSH